MDDVTKIAVPVWPALTGIGTFFAVVVGSVLRMFSLFERKDAAKERYKEFEKLERRVANQEELLGKIARDVSYMRGRMEGEEK